MRPRFLGAAGASLILDRLTTDCSSYRPASCCPVCPDLRLVSVADHYRAFPASATERSAALAPAAALLEEAPAPQESGFAPGGLTCFRVRRCCLGCRCYFERAAERCDRYHAALVVRCRCLDFCFPVLLVELHFRLAAPSAAHCLEPEVLAGLAVVQAVAAAQTDDCHCYLARSGCYFRSAAEQSAAHCSASAALVGRAADWAAGSAVVAGQTGDSRCCCPVHSDCR